MAGIVIEIGDASWTAFELWETRSIATKNDPLNQPIEDVTALAFLVFSSETNAVIPELEGLQLFVGDSSFIKTHRPAAFLRADTVYLQRLNPLAHGADNIVQIHFINAAPYKISQGAIRDLDKWNILELNISCEHCEKLDSGTVTITVNGSRTKKLYLPAQGVGKSSTFSTIESNGQYSVFPGLEPWPVK